MVFIKNKIYKKNKIKLILNKPKFVFLVNNLHKKAKMLHLLKQKLKPFYFTKLSNNSFKKIFSIFPKVINNSIFVTNLIKNNIILTKSATLNNFLALHFYILSFKLNNNIYSLSKFKNLNTLSYYQNKIKLIQTCLMNLKKIIFNFKNFSK